MGFERSVWAESLMKAQVGLDCLVSGCRMMGRVSAGPLPLQRAREKLSSLQSGPSTPTSNLPEQHRLSAKSLLALVLLRFGRFVLRKE